MRTVNRFAAVLAAVFGLFCLMASAVAQQIAAGPADPQLAALQPGQGQRIDYTKLGGWEKMNSRQQDWYKRNFQDRTDEGNGRCKFPNFNVRLQSDLRGPCFLTQGQMDAANAGQPLFFTATVTIQSVPYRDAQIQMTCQPGPKVFVAASFWKGHVGVCQVASIRISSSWEVPGVTDYAILVVDLSRNGRWVPMSSYDPQFTWMSVKQLRAEGSL
ncbi:MAG TPA: hypothetical protein VG984_03295 [Candidatus Paceibacterota bacterium]|nr:hypothetical protein [Candidatus Paceibacterota bacterium]